MEADKAGHVGYVGTLDDLKTFETKVKTFDDGKDLNEYFGGKGWPFYNTSDPAVPVGKRCPDQVSRSTKHLRGQYRRKQLQSLAHDAVIFAGTVATKGVLPATNGDYAETDLANLWFGWLNYYSKVSGTADHGQSLEDR